MMTGMSSWLIDHIGITVREIIVHPRPFCPCSPLIFWVIVNISVSSEQCSFDVLFSLMSQHLEAKFKTCWSSAPRANPSESAPYPTTGGGRWDGAQSNRECWLQSVVCILPPSPWQSSFWWCTSWLVGKLPQTLDWQTGPRGQQTPGCWKSLSYSLMVSCRLWQDASHIAGYNWDSGQKWHCRWGTRRRPLHQCNTIVHHDLYVSLSFPPLHSC